MSHEYYSSSHYSSKKNFFLLNYDNQEDRFLKHKSDLRNLNLESTKTKASDSTRSIDSTNFQKRSDS